MKQATAADCMYSNPSLPAFLTSVRKTLKTLRMEYPPVRTRDSGGRGGGLLTYLCRGGASCPLSLQKQLSSRSCFFCVSMVVVALVGPFSDVSFWSRTTSHLTYRFFYLSLELFLSFLLFFLVRFESQLRLLSGYVQGFSLGVLTAVAGSPLVKIGPPQAFRSVSMFLSR